ncbi:MAG: nucleotidyltransferase domain-containing protein [Bacteroidota bacterium]
MPPDLNVIRRRLADARADLARRYPLRRLGIFGSVARGEAGPDSDVDVLVEFSAPVGFEVVDLALDLEALLEHPVDLVTRGALGDRVAPYVEKDLVYV